MSLNAKMIRKGFAPAPMKRTITNDANYMTPHRKIVQQILQEAEDARNDEIYDFTIDQSSLEKWQTRNRFRG